MTSAFDPILEPFIEAIDDAFIRFLTTADLTPAEPSDDVMIVHRGYTQSQVNVTDWSVPEATDAEVRWRIHLLRRAGHLIHQGRVPEAGGRPPNCGTWPTCWRPVGRAVVTMADPMTDRPDILKVALWLAGRGLHVFPVARAGKRPTIRWTRDATKDPEQVAAFFAGTDHNIGIACGPSGLVVIDEDVADAFARFAESIGEVVPATFTVATGKGRHYYFLAPEGVQITNRTGALPDGVDVRGERGYVIGPGSVHANGAVYRPEDPEAGIAPCPAWLLRALTGSSTGPHLHQPSDNHGPIPAGKRDDTLWDHAARLRLAGIDRAEAEERLRRRWEDCEQPPGDEYRWETAKAKLDRAWAELTPHDDAPTLGDLDDFWTARPVLTHVHHFALARRACPWAVLGVVLARAVCAIEPYVMLPPLVGSPASLNQFFALVGDSGAGKDAAIGAAGDAIDVGHLVTTGVGSGQGIAHQYATRLLPKKGDPGGVRQHTSRVHLVATEVDTLTGLTRQQGSSTLLPELRAAWTGSALGYSYVDPAKRLHLPAHTYRLALIVGVQPERAGVLLNDAARAAGTPARFLWLPANNPDAPDVAPAEPAPITFHPPWPPLTELWGPPAVVAPPPSRRITMEVCRGARADIDTAYLARHRGDPREGDEPHGPLARLKVAGILALLDGRAGVTQEDWDLAGVIHRASIRTREWVERRLTEANRRANQARGTADGERDAARTERGTEIREDAVARVARLVRTKLADAGNWVTRSDLRNAVARRDRGYFDDAVAALADAGQTEERTEGRATYWRLAEGAS